MSNDNLHSDLRVLLTKAAEGDSESFRIIFEGYWDLIVANAQRFLKQEDKARDVAQEVFIRLWTSRRRLADVSNFDGYIVRMLRNVIYDSMKLSFKEHVSLEQVSNTQGETKEHRQLEAKELEKQINEAIESLPEQMQKAFKLSRFENLTHEQISKVMNISKTTSQNYIARAIIYIRKHLSQYARVFLLALFLFKSK